MQLRLGLILGLVSLSLVGCARFGLDNSSLDYKQTQTLAPLVVPEGTMMRPQQALYPAPRINPQALEQAPEFINKHGNQFEMPRPKASNVVVGVTGSAPSRPQIVLDGNSIPLLRVDGSSDQVWKYALAALSTSNIRYDENKAPYQAIVEYNEQKYRLSLTPSGTSNTIGVYDERNHFIDATLANEILTLIHQNWPA